MISLKKYKASNNEVILYNGNPNLTLLDELSKGSGDVWHSSYNQGFKNCFQDLMYQTAIYWWFINDFENVDTSVNWRININNFAVRETVYNQLPEFDNDFENDLVSGLNLGFNLLRNSKAVPLYVKSLFQKETIEITISKVDRYLFYLKNFKKKHSFYMMARKGFFKFPSEYYAYKKAIKLNKNKIDYPLIKPRKLNEINGKPTVSLVIPTMKRQEYAELLLNDHNNQTYLIKEAVIVDATPENERDDKFYNPENFKFNIIVKWQTTKGSCRARNEAINLCTSDYIIFADDDVRVFPDFVENHIKLLQTYNAKASNGLDIMAQNVNQNLSDLKDRLDLLKQDRWRVGVSPMFSNANSIVKTSLVHKLIGNDINFDGGYGEDSDFGLRIIESGEVLLHNPFSANLHLKPPQGGYRFWGQQASIIGKNRKAQPWELNKPVKTIKPVPSPTITYGVLKHFKKHQIKEWRVKHFFIYLFTGSKRSILAKLLKLPYKQLQFKESLKYAKRLIDLGSRYE